MEDDSVSGEALKEKVEQLKKSSMKIGEAMYKNAGDGGTSSDQSADYENVNKEGENKEGDKKDDEKK